MLPLMRGAAKVILKESKNSPRDIYGGVLSRSTQGRKKQEIRKDIPNLK